MASPSSPYRLSPSSACSSTLIMTPAPPHHHQRGPAPKGHLQPHISNLPRRRRAPGATTLRISAPQAPSSSSLSPSPKEENANSTSSSYAPSPIQIPSLFPFGKGGLMPPRNGVLNSQGIWQAYRESPTTTAPSSSTHRGRKRALQELGYGSGYFVAFEKLGSGEEGEDEDMVFGATIRITHEEEVDDEACVIEDKRGDDDRGAELRLVVSGSSRDDGVPNLTPAQLRAAVAFGRRQREEGHQVLITVPPRNPVDALSIGACCIAIEEPDTITKEELSLDEDADADVERIHLLLVPWHDMPLEELAADDSDSGHLGGGLGDAWRGLLSRDGIEYLASAMRGADALPTPVSFSPPASPPPSA
ncbi:hypothetical protein R3P38DRAFT_3070610 [Favolaschia claudopus]|uniref:Uncharacterized protein n=1 Tax=Favolaschia claudopus TaxID=2862362 RepID=A0AAW0A002_9AGAR